MKILPKKSEIQAVTALLESAEFESAEDLARFMAKVDVAEDDECWEWRAARSGLGYGRFALRRKTLIASRVMLSWVTGTSLDTPLVAMHLCDNPPCVNPAHLRWGTQRENIQMAGARGHMPGMPLQSFCRKGLHPMVEGNLYFRPNGDRRCRRCTLDLQNAERRRAA